MAVGPDRLDRVLLADEGIVLGHPAVVVQAVDFAIGQFDALRQRPLAAVADSEVQITLAVKGKARAVVVCVRGVKALRHPVDHLDIDQAAPLQFAARNRRIAQPPTHRPPQWVGIRQIDQAVLRVVGMQRHIHQSALAARVDLGHPRHRCRDRAILADDAQATLALGYQQPPVGQECHAPRHAETLGEAFDAEGVLRGFDGFLRASRTSKKQYCQ